MSFWVTHVDRKWAVFALYIHRDAAKIVMPRCLALIRDLDDRTTRRQPKLCSARAQMMLLVIQINYMPPNGHVIDLAYRLRGKNWSNFEVVKNLSVLLDQMAKRGQLNQLEWQPYSRERIPIFCCSILIDQKQNNQTESLVAYTQVNN